MKQSRASSVGGHRDTSTAETFHVPILVREVVELLVTDRRGVYVDATLGGGGHTRAILKELDSDGRVIGIDMDPEAIAAARAKLADDQRWVPVQARFSHIKDVVQEMGVSECTGVLADFGVSSHQIDRPQRGFSYLADGPLDMRMNPGVGTPASDLLQKLDEAELASIFHRYGEERMARKIARAIVAQRKMQPLAHTRDLAAIVESVVPGKHAVKSLARVFQALRIAVNEELCEIEAFLDAAFDVLKSRGRLVVISYHSLEDRLVKQFFRMKARGCICPPEAMMCTCGHQPEIHILTKKVVRASEDEIRQNPRARSAKLRAFEKV
ncbi:MAG: 16S rRNA (cytosine(1402)-N(4))-methyltransferase RsmH [candidate division KSB1 bacterium]|nr:16S rRNA (cytosine(1402)-N(4))-methyltransferase RsmH [candidate division KSB1 bacterium]